MPGPACAAWSPWPPRSPCPRRPRCGPSSSSSPWSSRSARCCCRARRCRRWPAALDVRGPDPREDALQEATVLGATTGAGLRLIEADPSADEATVAAIRDQATARVNRSWERLGTLGPGDDETPSEARARVRTEMIREERAELLRIRDLGGRRPRGAHLRAGPARRRGVRADLERHALRRRAPVTAATAGPDRRRLRAPRRRRDPQGADDRRGLPAVPRRGPDLGAPARLRRVRQRRLLRLLGRQARARPTSTRPATR